MKDYYYKEMRAEALRRGMCSFGVNKWPAANNLAGIYGLFTRGIDFCLKNNLPTSEQLGKMKKDDIEGIRYRYGIFIDENFTGKNLRHCITNGACYGELVYDLYSYGAIYVRHNSTVSLTVKDHAIVQVELYDTSRLIINNEGGKVFVYQYGGTIVGEGAQIRRRNHSPSRT